MCEGQHLLPMGQHDTPAVSAVKLYCARCEDLYNPKSSRHATIDGAYFGSSFHNILFQVYPNIMPPKSVARYEPRVFGFKVHAAAALQRWQDSQRIDMQDRLRAVGVEADFVGDDVDEYDEEEEDLEGNQIID
jgi:casein kinase II subunit beta